MFSDCSSSANVFKNLEARELNGKTKAIPPNKFPEYHLQVFKNICKHPITDMVIAGDIIFVLYTKFDRIPYLRDADGEISPLTDHEGSPVIMRFRNIVDFVCYNNYNDSLLMVIGGFPKIIKSTSIALIKAGQTTTQEIYFPSDTIHDCDFDIPNCRGMMYNENERLFTIFELKEYRKLFTIPDESVTPWGNSHFRFLSPCNREMGMYNIDNSSSGEISLKVYSKFDGRLGKQISLHVHPQYYVVFIALCGSETVLVQQEEMKMQIINIASERPEVIKTTEIQAQCCPYYLDKREQFVCYTISNNIHVCNLQGDILFTFLEFELSGSNLFDGPYITRGQDIFMCTCPSMPIHKSTINVLNIVAGECLAKIESDSSQCSEMRKRAMVCITALAYDESTREIFTGNAFGICCRWSNKILEDTGDMSNEGILTI